MSSEIMVVGANSQLGQVLHKIRPQWRALSQKQLDLKDLAQIKKYFIQKPKVLINFAAFTAVDLAEQKKSEALTLNAEAVAELSQCCEYFIHISTDYVYSGESKRPYTEVDQTAPVNFYGQSKLAGEQKALAAHSKSYIIRTSWLYSHFGVNFVKRMIELAKVKSELRVVNDQWGTPTWAEDLIQAIILFAEQPEKYQPGVYNFSNEGQCTWFEFAREIFKYKNVKIPLLPITTVEYPTPARRPGYSVLDKSKIKNELKIQIPTWQNGLERFVKSESAAIQRET